MKRFQYFIPNKRTANLDDIKAAGLGYAIDKSAGPRAVSLGPGGTPGAIVCQGPDMPVGYYPDMQTWVPAPSGDSDEPPYWIGFDPANKPTPDDLVRENVIAGGTVKMEDGSAWIVPETRSWRDEGGDLPQFSTRLPSMIDCDAHGRPCDGKIVPRYRDLFDTGLEVLIYLVHRQGSDASTVLQYGVNCIETNYRVSMFELGSQVLDCLSTDAMMDAIQVAIDLEGYQAALKKSVGRQVRPTTDTDSGSEQ